MLKMYHHNFLVLQIFFFGGGIESVHTHTALFAHGVTGPSIFRKFLPGYRRLNSGGNFMSFILLKHMHLHHVVYIIMNYDQRNI